ncbi:uncharacterized protein EV422DRAFT_42632 [Fimicolochytrium jonesii]|uniref:uncharacterized protein n=1 Tax=Fimicolochytrium jonesii TaxID=1396493 RepID=UPI0022FF2E1E|nr:uncharacterized protein EV422DRAFT_42632 [Fimicolochytrium jonesii]KAI8821442.1 hypothetical protein EV422DRAFT_42632 [Fimicolochytrium jonesii]
MPKYTLAISADLENVTNLKPQDVKEYDWKIKFKCLKCQEDHKGFVVVNASEEVEQANTRGVANLVMKCKSCKNEGTANILVETLKPYQLQSSGKFAPIIQIESRGLEPVDFGVADGWQAEGAESGTPFKDIPLGEGEEWAEYDEKASEPVGITEVKGRVEKA